MLIVNYLIPPPLFTIRKYEVKPQIYSNPITLLNCSTHSKFTKFLAEAALQNDKSEYINAPVGFNQFRLDSKRISPFHTRRVRLIVIKQ